MATNVMVAMRVFLTPVVKWRPVLPLTPRNRFLLLTSDYIQVLGDMGISGKTPKCPYKVCLFELCHAWCGILSIHLPPVSLPLGV